MAFLDWLANLLAPSAPSAAGQALPQADVVTPAEPAPSLVPAQLPKISARTAAELCQECKPEPVAMELLKPQQTPAQFLTLLQERHLSADMTKVLAQGLPDREGVAWAVLCVQRVADKLPAADVQALRVAQAWVKNPTSDLQKAATQALELTDRQGPGAWAAQAAAWAKADAPEPLQASNQESASRKKVTSEKPEPPRLTPQAVSAAVGLSATILARPEYAVRKLQMMEMAMGAVAGLSVGGVSVSHLSGMASNLQAPHLGAAGSLASLAAGDMSVPQLPGAAGRVQAGIAALPSAGGISAAAANLPGVANAMSHAAGAGSAAHAAIPQSAAVAAALAGAAALPNLPNAAAYAISGALPHMQMPGVPDVGLAHFSQPNLPQFTSATLPPAVLEFMFREQQPFIRIGLEIASGVIPVA